MLSKTDRVSIFTQGQTFLVAKLSGIEKIQSYPSFTVTLFLTPNKLEYFQLNLELTLHINKEPYHLIVSEIETQWVDNSTHKIKLKLEHKLVYLTLSSRRWVFINKKIKELITALLKTNKVPTNQLKLTISEKNCGHSIQLPNENDYTFFLRILKAHNIFFTCKNRQIVFFETLPDRSPKPFSLPDNYNHVLTENPSLQFTYKNHFSLLDSIMPLGIEKPFFLSEKIFNFRDCTLSCTLLFNTFLNRPEKRNFALRVITGLVTEKNSLYYTVRLFIDPKKQAIPCVASSTLTSSDKGTQSQQACHFPISVNAEVIILVSETELTILGTLNHHHTPSRINRDNDQQDLIQSCQGHHFLIDTKKKEMKLQLGSKSSSLSLSEQEHELSIKSENNAFLNANKLAVQTEHSYQLATNQTNCMN